MAYYSLGPEFFYSLIETSPIYDLALFFFMSTLKFSKSLERLFYLWDSLCSLYFIFQYFNIKVCTIWASFVIWGMNATEDRGVI